MAKRSGKKSVEADASKSGFDWGKVTTIAVAVTAVSGALVAVSGNFPKLISAFSGGGAVNESAAAGNPAANPVGPTSARAEPADGTAAPQPQGARFVRHRDGSEETLCAPGQNLVRGDCVWPPRVVALGPCLPGWERYRGRCEEASRVPVPDCPPGWTRDADGVCQAPPPPPVETRQCPDGSTIPVTQECPRQLPVGIQQCPDGALIPVAQECPRIERRIPGPFIVFFDWDKDGITPAAAAILDNAAAGYQEVGSASVVLAGHADRSGSDAYNLGLSRRRADNVRSYLAGRGVPDTAITSRAYGESHPLVETSDGVREPQNRRVEITFGPSPGR